MSPDHHLCQLLDHNEGDVAAVVPGKNEQQVNYGLLKAIVERLSNQIATLGCSGPVTLVLPNNLEFLAIFLATTSAGLVSAPLNPALREDEFNFYFEDANTSLVVLPEGACAKSTGAVSAARAKSIAIAECYSRDGNVNLEIKERGNLDKSSTTSSSPEPDRTALMLHTSGTTGKPKAVPLTHRNLLTSAATVSKTYQLSRNDRTMLIMPLYHIHGIVAGFLAPLFSGGSIIISSSVGPSFWPSVAKHNATWFTGTPTMHTLLLQQPRPDPMPRLRFVRSCSSPLSPTSFQKLEEFYRTPVLEAYAMTEAAHQISSNPLPPGERAPGTVGFPTDVDVCIMDESGNKISNGTRGEICIRGANVTKGYLHNEAANVTSFTTEGFFRTGDEGIMLENGALKLTGRLKELINKGGEKISPIEVDNVLAKHPDVQEAVSFSIEDPVWGEDVGCAIALKPGSQIDEAAIKRWMRERAALFKVPKRIYFVDSIPKTATGKVQRLSVAASILSKT